MKVNSGEQQCLYFIGRRTKRHLGRASMLIFHSMCSDSRSRRHRDSCQAGGGGVSTRRDVAQGTCGENQAAPGSHAILVLVQAPDWLVHGIMPGTGPGPGVALPWLRLWREGCGNRWVQGSARTCYFNHVGPPTSPELPFRMGSRDGVSG